MRALLLTDLGNRFQTKISRVLQKLGYTIVFQPCKKIDVIIRLIGVPPPSSINAPQVVIHLEPNSHLDSSLVQIRAPIGSHGLTKAIQRAREDFANSFPEMPGASKIHTNRSPDFVFRNRSKFDFFVSEPATIHNYSRNHFIHKKTNQIQLQAAKQYLNQRNYRKARSVIRGIISMDPLCLQAYSLGLRIATKTRDQSGFEFFASRLFNLNPSIPSLYLAAVHFPKSTWALKLMQVALDYCPRHPQIQGSAIQPRQEISDWIPLSLSTPY